MDDFVVSAFLSSGSTTDTVPVRIYSSGRTAPTPALNALATLTLAITLLVAFLAFLLWRIVQLRRGRTGSTLQEFARLDTETTNIT
jgi:spermidine/putrescine transport system permease protein